MTNDIIIKRIYSKKTIDKLNKKIAYLGIDNKMNIYRFLNIKLVLIILSFIIILMFSKLGYILAPASCVIIYFLYDYLFLELPIKKRANILEHDAIFFFEVLALTLESDRSLKSCLEITSKTIDSSISKEICFALKEVELGKSLDEALTNLRNRIPSKSVDNLILNLIEANSFGNNIVDTLKSQITYITDKRILKIKGDINKMPTKVSIISVFFFIPLMLLLVLGPVLINYFLK